MIGQTVLHYKIIEKLGEGGMGVVYKAEDSTLNRMVALKFLPDRAIASGQDTSRFTQEARAAANLNHPNICTIHAIDQADGRHFIVMEYVDGVTLNEKIPFKILNAAYDAAIQVGDALAEAHAKGIVHRDVKSENIMITAKGQVKVMDFGLAKLKGSLKLTRTSSTVGTLGYMSPEQIQGGDVDHRSDIFSLGVVLFEMVTGQLPFRGEHEAAIVYSIVNEAPKPVTDVLKDAPQGLVDIFSKAFEKDPNERYQSAADLAVDLKRLKKQSSTMSRSRVGAVSVAGGGPGRTAAPDREGDDESRRPRASKIPLLVASVLLALSLLYIGYLQLFELQSPATAGLSVSPVTELAGEELTPDISPDGNYVVYVKEEGGNADIYHQRLGGGNPRNLTQGSGTRNTHPAFSPKGDLIAFRSEREGGGIFLMGSTGESVRRLTREGFNPSWSPEADKIVYATESLDHPFARATTSSLWIVNVQDGSTKKIYDGDGVQPRWSPDGSRILFWGLPRGTGKRELFIIGAGGGEPVRLTDDDAIDWNPVWDPGGEGIYFLSDRGGTMNVWRMEIDSRAVDPVTVPSQNCTWMTISRDGEKLLFLSAEIRRNIYRSSFDPSSAKLVSPEIPVTEGSRVFHWLDVSPDGRSLAFTIVGVKEDIGIIGTDGIGFRKLTNDKFKDRGPKWSPDGKQIGFYSERSGKYQIWKVNADGSDIQVLTNDSAGGVIAFPVWMPDQKRIYFRTDDSLGFLDPGAPDAPASTTFIRDVEGGGEYSITSANPDGRRLVGELQWPDGTSRGIVVYDVQTAVYTNLLEYGYSPVWLADGRTIIFLHSGKLHLLGLEKGTVRAVEGLPRIDEAGQYAISPDNHTLYFGKTESESDIWQAHLR
jgi:Tol biopolymer transport system component/serine/threonine protein kinase